MRTVLAVALSVAIQAAGLSAPLVHAHPDDHATDHHSGRAVHTHWAGHEQSHTPFDGPAFSPAEQDRAVFLNAFVAIAASAFPAPAVAPDVFEMPVSTERAAHRSLEISHGHDPPCARSIPSRAPPAFPS